MFWIACVDQMSNDNTNIWVVGPLATFSFLSFSVAIAVGADSAVNFVPGGAWPTDNGCEYLLHIPQKQAGEVSDC